MSKKYPYQLVDFVKMTSKVFNDQQELIDYIIHSITEEDFSHYKIFENGDNTQGLERLVELGLLVEDDGRPELDFPEL